MLEIPRPAPACEQVQNENLGLDKMPEVGGQAGKVNGRIWQGRGRWGRRCNNLIDDREGGGRRLRLGLGLDHSLGFGFRLRGGGERWPSEVLRPRTRQQWTAGPK